MQLADYMTARQAATALGLRYETLLARVRSGKIKAERAGWAVLIHREEVERHAGNSHLEEPAR